MKVRVSPQDTVDMANKRRESFILEVKSVYSSIRDEVSKLDEWSDLVNSMLALHRQLAVISTTSPPMSMPLGICMQLVLDGYLMALNSLDSDFEVTLNNTLDSLDNKINDYVVSYMDIEYVSFDYQADIEDVEKQYHGRDRVH